MFFKVSWFLSLFMFLDLSYALYFHMSESERQCFFEEIPDDITVIGNYKVELYDPKTGGVLSSRPSIGMHVEVTGPNKEILLSRTYTSEGKIAFTSSVSGDHAICLYATNGTWWSNSHLRVHLDIHLGVDVGIKTLVPHKKKVSELHLGIAELLNLVNYTAKEQMYARYREQKFRNTSESTNQYVLWWGIAQIIILIAVGYWQMRSLKSFFAAKKLV